MALRQTKPQLRSAFKVVSVTPNVVWLVDTGHAAGAMSVTNDAENVVAWVTKTHGLDKRIFYRDSLGRWDELEHSKGFFTGYKPGCAGFTPPSV